MVFTVMHVAEKPSVAKQLAPHLCTRGTNPRRKADSSWHTLEFKGNWLSKGEVSHVMTSVRGHLLSQDFTPEYRAWHACEPVQLMDEGSPIESFCPEDMKNVHENLQKLAKTCHLLVLWTDCDREGEHIGYEIMQVCQEAKRNLQCLRAQFSCCTKGEVAKAVRTLRPLHMGMVNAVAARTEIDLRIGAAFTRFQTKLLQSKYSELSEGVVSYGSCQIPTLGFIVARQNKIEGFVPESYWSIQMKYTDGRGGGGGNNSSSSSSSNNNSNKRNTRNKTSSQPTTATFTWARNRLFHRVACLTIFEDCVERGCATITKQQRKPRSKWRPVPLSTIEMTKKLSRCRHMSAKRIQETAEKLYSKGILSYPRTETEVFRPDFDLRGLIAPHSQSPLWGTFAQNLLGGDGFQTPRSGQSDDNAHPPIHPLKFVALQDLENQDEKTVYEFVVRHFLACCSKDALGSGVNIEATMGTETFSASGLAIEERNYLDVYIYDKWVGNTIPDLRLHDVFVPTVFNMTSSRTKVPLFLSEADLIALMEKNGIGTDATMGQHIEKIKEREYVKVVEQQGDRQPRLRADKLGIALCNAYTTLNIAFSKPQIRQQMEKDSKEIENGTKTKDLVVRQCLEAHVKHFKTLAAQRHIFADACDNVLGEHYSLLGENDEVVQQQFGWCGTCNVSMCLKKKKKKNHGGREQFLLWCDDCDTCLPVGPPGNVEDPREKCSACGFGKVKMSSHQNWTLCVKCKATRTPAVDVIVARCFAASCHSKQMHIKQKDGKWELSCSTCGYNLRMPTCTKKVELRTDGGQHRMCGECKRVPKFNVTLGGRMAPGENNREIRCLKCDDYLREGLSGWHEKKNTRGGSGSSRSSSSSSSSSNSSSGSRGGRNGNQGSRGRQNRNNSTNNNRSNSTSNSSNNNSGNNSNDSGRGRKKATTSRTTNRSKSGTRARTSARGNNAGAGDGTCSGCQQPASTCTVKKEGENQGRQFWKCFSCDKWMGWCDEQGKENGKRGGSGGSGGRTKRTRR
jgi:DNA topoisomerase III